MHRDPRYDILFEPVQIGPVVARNRFYQVPHCCGMGYQKPNTAAAMRGMKAEGGWAVVSTEECDIHHTSDVSPHVEQRLWSDADIPQHVRMVESVHEHGSLAAIELAHNGIHAPNHFTRSVALAPSAGPNPSHDPAYASEMTLRDIREMRAIYRKAALRARTCGFDIVYVYAAHMLTLPAQFISRKFNQRTDEYGGSLENRVRFLKELIIDAKEAVGDTCGIAVRLMVDELLGVEGLECDGEGIEIVSMLAELPDIWDVNISDWDNDSATSRFQPEGFQEQYIRAVKSVTTKPVVGVGRFTSPDTMVSQIRRGVLDMIGAARPSIADPFLPKKIEEGRIEDIRECIGCNICVSGDYTITPIRCTQNPTMGEEWRRGWHPEIIPSAKSEDFILIVGGGPASLECAVALGKRGHKVAVAESLEHFGGRVSRESRLPGLSAWGRVCDYRLQQLDQLNNVELYPASELTASDIIEFNAERVVFATGSKWRRDGVGREHAFSIGGSDGSNVYTPDDIMDGLELKGDVVIYDDDHFYMGGVVAELVKASGANVAFVTPASVVSEWTHKTLEQRFIQERLIKLGVSIHANSSLAAIHDDCVDLRCVYSAQITQIRCDSVILATSRKSDDDLYQQFVASFDTLNDTNIVSADRIGDCHVPGTIAAAVYSGHLWARQIGEPQDQPDVPFARDMVLVE